MKSSLRRRSSVQEAGEYEKTGNLSTSNNMDTTIDLILVVVLLMSCINIVQALPFPAPKLNNCLPLENCCLPNLSSATKAKKFEFQTHLPMRTRPAAHLVDDAYIAKYQRAVELMKALPDTDGRSFTNQWKVHCLYCDNHLYFEEGTDQAYPLEIHKSWLFFPWHRLFVYFHERILAKLIDDDTFALPFWNWDNQSPELPQANVVPKLYTEERSHHRYATDRPVNGSSPLFDETRSHCAMLPNGIVNLQSVFACPGENTTEIRAANAHVMYVNMVGVATTPLLFHGWPYRFGDKGGGGAGAMEIIPHAAVHGWVNQMKMLAFRDAASDPIFFAHHANMDRLWEIWKTLPGGIRDGISDPDYLDTEFTFIDENNEHVTISVAQSLELDQLRYKYEEVDIPWLANGAVQGKTNAKWKTCSLSMSVNASEKIEALIENTEQLTEAVNFTKGPLTFKVSRNLSRTAEDGEEILEVYANVDYAQRFLISAFAFYPEAMPGASWACGEYLGVMGNVHHVGISPTLLPQFVWRMGIRKQLELMGRENVEYVVVTLIGTEGNGKKVTFTGARTTHWKD